MTINERIKLLRKEHFIGLELNTKGIIEDTFLVNTPGEFSAYNASSAILTTYLIGCKVENIKKYKLVYISKRIASVELPNPTTNVIEFVKTSLKEKHPTITIFEWEGCTLYGCEKEMKLVEI